MSNKERNKMLNFNEMTPKEAYEAYQHFIVHDFADLCLKYGYDFMIAQLAEVLDNKVDKLEPVVEEFSQ